jgi:hypothetical protein
LDLSGISLSLAGRPMSDAAWVVNESARLTARAKQDRISEVFLNEAFDRLRSNTSIT